MIRKLTGTLLRRPQLIALNFSGRGLGQLGDKLDPARVFVRQRAVFDKYAQFLG